MFDEVELTFDCPICGQKIKESIGRLKKNPDLICGGCGGSVHIEADDLKRGIEEVEKAIAKFGAAFR